MMKIFTTTTIDNETRNDLIAMECSFNAACSFLMKKGFYNPIVTSSDSRFIWLDFGNVTFIYDEKRSYLLREVFSEFA